MSDNPSAQLPAETPANGARAYAWVFLIVSFISLLAGGLDKLALLPDSAAKVCRAFYLCAPRPLKPLPPFETIQPSGSTWGSVEQDQVPPQRKIVEQDNPDYDIVFQQGHEDGGSCSGPFKTDCRYHYYGSWKATPKWRSIFDYALTWVILACVSACSIFVVFVGKGRQYRHLQSDAR